MTGAICEIRSTASSSCRACGWRSATHNSGDDGGGLPPAAAATRAVTGGRMFIAMYRFKVTRGSDGEFERVWTTRDTHLQEVEGFVEFHLLRGPERDDHVLYASHTVWRSRDDFEAWTRSEA